MNSGQKSGSSLLRFSPLEEDKLGVFPPRTERALEACIRLFIDSTCLFQVGPVVYPLPAMDGVVSTTNPGPVRLHSGPQSVWRVLSVPETGA